MNQEPLGADHPDGDPFAGPVPLPYVPRGLKRLRGALRAALMPLGSTPPNFVTRAQWGAQPPKGNLSTNIDPQDGGVAWHYEGPKMGVYAHDKCAGKVRQIQAFHQGPDRGWVDIAYTALVCPHGFVFEGRGTGKRTAANGSNDGNQRFYALCALIGDGDAVTESLKQGMVAGTRWLRTSGKAGTAVKPHRFFKATACPGNVLASLTGTYDGKEIGGTAPTTGHTHRQPVLTKGSKDSAINDVQGHLNYAYRNYSFAPLEITGVFDERTHIRLRDWQGRTGIKVTGVVDAATWERLHEVTDGVRWNADDKPF